LLIRVIIKIPTVVPAINNKDIPIDIATIIL